MVLNKWFVSENVFTKGFMDYVVKVEKSPSFGGGKATVDVTVWKGSGYENTKHTEHFENFEKAFAFVEEFSNQKFFEDVIEQHFSK